MEFLTGGGLIRDIRKKLSVTQRELGKDLINHNTISMIENGSCELTYKLAIRLSENINEIAISKGMDIRVNANLFLESAEDKCKRWCKQRLNVIIDIKNSDEKIKKYQEIFKVAEAHGIKDSLLDDVKSLGEEYYKSSRYSEAAECFDTCAKAYEQYNDIYNLADAYNSLGMCLYYSDLDKSYMYHSKAHALLEGIKNYTNYSLIKIKTNYFIALYYARINAFDKAEEYIDTIKPLACSDEDLNVKLLIVEATIKLRMQKYEIASKIYKELLCLADERIEPYRYMIYNNLGICLENLGYVEESIELLEKAIKYQLKKNTPDLTNSLVCSTKLQIKYNKHDIALRYVTGALTNALNFNQLDYVIECYKLNYIIYKGKGNLDKCMDTIHFLEKFLSDQKYVDKSRTLNLLELDYMLQKDSISDAKALLNDLLNERGVIQ